MHLIIGAGPAGMFCAHELKVQGKCPVILEKESYVGGLAATHKFGNNHFEIGPHIFYTQDQYILDIAQSYLGDDFITNDWSVAQYIEGHFFKFPNSAWDMTKKLGLFRMLEYLVSYLKYRGRKHQNYNEFIYSKVGKKLAEFNVINYTEKMWGVPLNELETEWIKPRLDRLSLLEIIKNTVRPKNRTYHYPRYGSGQLYELMKRSMTIHHEEYPTTIVHKHGRIIKVITNKNEYDVKALYSSLSLSELIQLLTPKAPMNVIKAAKALRYRSQIYVIIKLNVKDILNFQWVYFNEKSIPFCRIHEPKKFSDKNDLKQETLLVIEYFCFHNDKIWDKNEDELFELTKSHLISKEIIKESQIVGYKILKKKNAYPLMIKERQRLLATIFNYLKSLENLYSFGRHGLHTFDNQDTAGRSAINAVRDSPY